VHEALADVVIQARLGRADPGGIRGKGTAGIYGSRLSRLKALGRDDNRKAACKLKQTASACNH